MNPIEIYQTGMTLSGAPKLGQSFAAYPYRGNFTAVWVRVPSLGVSFLSSLDKQESAA